MKEWLGIYFLLKNFSPVIQFIKNDLTLVLGQSEDDFIHAIDVFQVSFESSSKTVEAKSNAEGEPYAEMDGGGQGQ